MRQLDHENIVKLLDFIETTEHFFIVLEQAPGGELFHQIVRLTYFSEDLARHVIIQVAQAINYLHEEAGVVHRDIKPENLLFYPAAFIPSPVVQVRAGEDPDSKQDEGVFIPGVGGGGIGVIKLADFGLSKIIWDSKTKTPCGTVGYTAPEIVNDQRYSKSVDMWALGCVLYTILCGFPPFYDEDIQALTEKVARGEYTFLAPWWDDISPEAKDLVSQLLMVDPERRFTIEQFMKHPWITQGNESSVSATASSAFNTNSNRVDAKAVAAAVSDPAQLSGASYFAGYTSEPSMPESIVTTNNPAKSKIPGTPKIPAHYFRQEQDGTETPTGRIVVPEGIYVPDKVYMSPAVVAMRDAFDLYNAVHRREEENATANWVPGARNSGGAKSVVAKRLAQERAGMDVLGELNEASEEDERSDKSDDEEVQQKEKAKDVKVYEDMFEDDCEEVEFPKIESLVVCIDEIDGLEKSSSNESGLSNRSRGSHRSSNGSLNNALAENYSNTRGSNFLSLSSTTPSPPLSNSENSSNNFFELNLEGSTLIERRKRASSSSSGSPLSTSGGLLGSLSSMSNSNGSNLSSLSSMSNSSNVSNMSNLTNTWSNWSSLTSLSTSSNTPSQSNLSNFSHHSTNSNNQKSSVSPFNSNSISASACNPNPNSNAHANSLSSSTFDSSKLAALGLTPLTSIDDDPERAKRVIAAAKARGMNRKKSSSVSCVPGNWTGGF